MDHETLLYNFFNKLPVECYGEVANPIKAFSLDDTKANKLRKSLKLSNTRICDYLLLPKDTADDLYIIEATDMHRTLTKAISRSKANSNNRAGKSHKSKQVPVDIDLISKELQHEVKEKILGTLLMFSRMVGRHSSVSKLFSINKYYIFALIVPSKEESKIARLYANLTGSLNDDLSKYLAGKAEVSLMDKRAVWSYKKFISAFKKKHPK